MRSVLSAMVVCVLASSAFGGIRAPGEYSGMVLFDRWGGCYLYSGIYVMYVSEKTKEGLRDRDRQWVQVDAKEVDQPINPGDGRIGKYQVIGAAPAGRNWVELDGLKLTCAAVFGKGASPQMSLVISNSGEKTIKVFSSELAITVLGQRKANSFGPSDGPSVAVITRQSFEIGGSEARWESSGVEDGAPYRWTIGAENALPHTFELGPGKKKTIIVTLGLPPGEYEFLAGYGGGVHETKGVASNSVAFDVGEKK